MQAPQSNTASGEEPSTPSFFASIRAAAAAQQKNSERPESSSSPPNDLASPSKDLPESNRENPPTSSSLGQNRTIRVESEQLQEYPRRLSAARLSPGLEVDAFPPTVLSRLISSANADRLRRKESSPLSTVQAETSRDHFGTPVRSTGEQQQYGGVRKDLFATRRTNFAYTSFDRDDRDHGDNNHSSIDSRHTSPTSPLSEIVETRSAFERRTESTSASSSNPPENRNREQSQQDQLTRAGLAHDAKNLLSALNLYSDLLALPDVLPERYRHYANDLRSLAKRSSTLIEDLIAFGGSVDRSISVPSGQADAIAVLNDCQSLLNTLAHGRLEITLGEQASLPVSISAGSLERILLNLVNNAVHATRERGTIRIRVGIAERTSSPLPARAAIAFDSDLRNAIPRSITDTKGEQDRTKTMVLTVDDSGCGMTEEQIRQISSPTPVRLEQRHGIGMQVVRSLVEASGGTLEVQSRIDIGTRVEVRWPLSDQVGIINQPSALHSEMMADTTQQTFPTRSDQLKQTSQATHPLKSRNTLHLSHASNLTKGAIAC